MGVLIFNSKAHFMQIQKSTQRKTFKYDSISKASTN